MELPDAPGETVCPRTLNRRRPQRGVGSISRHRARHHRSGCSRSHIASASPTKRNCVMQSGADGEFTFAGLPPGRFRVTVTSAGLGAFVSPRSPYWQAKAASSPGSSCPSPRPMSMSFVVASNVEIATEQVKLAEQQRVLGILPNFYSSYIWDAPPLTPKLKFDLAIALRNRPLYHRRERSAGWRRTGQQLLPRLRSGGRRLRQAVRCSLLGDEAISRMIGSAVLPSLLHQDPRYFYQGTGTHPLANALCPRIGRHVQGDNGHWQPNYSYIGGSFAAAGDLHSLLSG